MTTAAHRPTIAVTRHAISAGHYLASTAGFDILQAGGNAVDAGVAAGICLGVLQSDLVNVAGVAPIMIYLAEKREVVTIAGLGWWPKALDPNLFMREHGGKIRWRAAHRQPAAPDAWITALRRFGTMSFKQVAKRRAARRDGFPMYLLSGAAGKHAERHALAVERRGLFGGSRRRATSSARRAGAPCNTWPTRRRPPRVGRPMGAGARPASKRPALRFMSATSPRSSSRSTRLRAGCSRPRTSPITTRRSARRSGDALATSKSSPAARGARARCCCRRWRCSKAPTSPNSAITAPITCII